MSMSESIVPQQKTPKLIVVIAFDRDETGDLQPVYGPAEQHTEDRAIRPPRDWWGTMLVSSRGRETPIQLWANTASRPHSLLAAICQTWSELLPTKSYGGSSFPSSLAASRNALRTTSGFT